MTTDSPTTVPVLTCTRRDSTGEQVEVRYNPLGFNTPGDTPRRVLIYFPDVNEASFPDLETARTTLCRHFRLPYHRRELILDCMFEIEVAYKQMNLPDLVR